MMVLWWTTRAWADPAALRAPDRAPTAVLGFHELSFGAPFGPVDVAAEVRVDGGAAGVSIGLRRTLRSGTGGWRVDIGGSGGIFAPLVSPSLGVSATGWASAGVVGQRAYLQGIVAVPLAVSVDQGLRLPVLPELQGGLVVGPVLVGPRLSFGAVWVPGTDVSVATEAALAVSYRQ